MEHDTPPARGRDIATALPDPSALKALAHPDRLRMLGILRLDGPSTATGLAKRLGLNSGATSYHLRQLAEHGFIEAAPELGNRRDRWWRAAQEATRYDPARLEGDDAEVALAMVQGLLSQHVMLMQRALEQFPNEPQEWRDASNASDYIFTMTADQALTLKDKLMALLWQELRHSPAPEAEPPEGARRYMVLLHSFPVPELNADEEPA